jgi:SAM-dependent methyltransferase
MDAGCGWGVNLQALESAGYRAAGMDVSHRILELIDQPNRRLIEADLTQATPPSAERFDALLALDVIEHLDDDRAAIRTLSGMVRPAGLVIISVPARPDLFSEFDRIQGHRRRYVPETLRAAFEGSDFEPPQILWWGAWMVPVLRRMRGGGGTQASVAPKSYVDYLRLPPWPIPLMMRMAYAWEHGRALKRKLNNGTSLFAIARRR